MGNYLDSGFNEKLMRTSFGDLPQNQAVDVVNAGEVIATGAIPISAVTDALTSANIINSDNLIITDVINENLDTQAKEILGEFIFVATGALAMATDSDNGLWISPTGILGKKAGVNTFAVDTSGNATFAGSLVAATGTLGALTIATGGNIKKGKTAYSDDTHAGFWLGDDSGTTKMNFGANATTYMHYDGSNLVIAGGAISGASITGSTITGGTIQTSTSGRRIKIAANNYIKWYDGDDTEAYMYTDSSGNFKIDADESIYLQSDNLYFTSQDGGIYITAEDACHIEYNENGGSNGFIVIEDGSSCFIMDEGRDGWFKDDVQIVDTLNAGTKNFKIDHPLKPETHYLYHSSVEAPDRYLMYKGRGEIKNGICKIDLPDYFEALNRDFDYNLTSIGQKNNLWISKEVKNNKFEVSGDEDGNFSWLVYGIRHDNFALANPMVIEEEKEVKGYTHPEPFGETESVSEKVLKENKKRKKKGLKPVRMHNKKQ